jgi:phage terminase Nu1 subunit (DNA packaging protein)
MGNCRASGVRQMMSQSALGRALGLSKQAISKLKGQGMPVDSVEAAQAWREARQNVAQRKPAPAGVAVSSAAVAAAGGLPAGQVRVNGLPVFGVSPAMMAGMPPPGDMPELADEDRDAARTRREIAEANLAEMREAESKGDLIRVAVVKTTLATSYSTIRENLLQIPARLAPLLAAEGDAGLVQGMLHEEIHRALVELASAPERLVRAEGTTL